MSRTADFLQDQERRRAWTAARQAVRSYARDPSSSNASQVEQAWRELRESRIRSDAVSALSALNGGTLDGTSR